MSYANEHARLDVQLTKSQKEFFELAARISGFKSLSEFVIYSTQQVANGIVEKHNAILATEQDRKVFFDALVNPAKPNKSLKDAGKHYWRQVAAKGSGGTFMR